MWYRLLCLKSQDPHVERMLQGVAFLAARVQKRLDDDYPELTDGLLDLLYPHYLRPVPSLAIAEFAIDLKQAQLTSGYRIPRGTTVETEEVEGERCRYRTWLGFGVVEITKRSQHSPGIRKTESTAIGSSPSLRRRIRARCRGPVMLAPAERRGRRAWPKDSRAQRETVACTSRNRPTADGRAGWRQPCRQ